MLNVVVSSAVALTSAQLKKITQAVTEKYGNDAAVSAVVDTSLIGGLTITVGSRQVDGSVKGKLNLIKKTLEENTH